MVTTALLLVIRQAIALETLVTIRGSGADGLQALNWRRLLGSDWHLCVLS